MYLQNGIYWVMWYMTAYGGLLAGDIWNGAAVHLGHVTLDTSYPVYTGAAVLICHVRQWNEFMAARFPSGEQGTGRTHACLFYGKMNEWHWRRDSPLRSLLARFNSLGHKACAHPGVQSKRPAWAAHHVKLAAVCTHSSSSNPSQQHTAISAVFTP